MIKWFKRLIYSLQFGLKGAEIEALGQKSSPLSELDGIHETIQSRRVSDALLRGEVTQEVEELRYRDYTVSNESKKYTYLGDGIAIKEKKEEKDINNFSFLQENHLVCKSVLEQMNIIDDVKNDNDSYVLSILYDVFPRFRLESYCRSIELFIEDGKCLFKLRFSSLNDKYKVSTGAFVNELKKINENIEYSKKSEILTSILQISFTTYKAINEDDLVRYQLSNISFNNIELDGLEYILSFTANDYIRENLIEKFYSETMAKKYAQNEKKDIEYSIFETNRVEKCSQCGKEMSTYDADITKQSLGYALCTECLERKIIEENLALDK